MALEDKPQKKSRKDIRGPSTHPHVPQDEGARVPQLEGEREEAAPERPGVHRVEPPSREIRERPSRDE